MIERKKNRTLMLEKYSKNLDLAVSCSDLGNYQPIRIRATVFLMLNQSSTVVYRLL